MILKSKYCHAEPQEKRGDKKVKMCVFVEKIDKRQEEIVKAVIAILVRFVNPKKILIFGSRAKKNNRRHSDFDFAVDGPKPSLSLERKINEEIERASGLYKVDIVYMESIDKEFKTIILKTGKVLYKSRGPIDERRT